jgi:hypothetical protein
MERSRILLDLLCQNQLGQYTGGTTFLVPEATEQKDKDLQRDLTEDDFYASNAD